MASFSRARLQTAAAAAWQRLRGGALEPRRAGGSVAIGAFVTCLPLYGLQTPLCALLTLPARLDFALAWMVTLLANPVTAPLLAIGEVELGAWLCTGERVALPTLHTAARDLLPYARLLVVGSLALGAVAAALGGGLAYALARAMVRRRARLHSITRTESM